MRRALYVVNPFSWEADSDSQDKINDIKCTALLLERCRAQQERASQKEPATKEAATNETTAKKRTTKEPATKGPAPK